MNGRHRKRKRNRGLKETILLILAIAAVFAAISWKIPAKSAARAETPETRLISTGTQTPEPKTRQLPEPDEVILTATPEPQETPEPTPEPEPKKTYLGKFTTTAYCSCEICCGEWAKNRPGGIVYTASGAEAVQGVTVGAAWDVLPAGTRIEIEGLGERVVQDCPADWIIEKYGGRIIDVYFSDHQAAQDYGKQTVDVWIIEDEG